jgi:hypothetical protein
MNDFPNEINYHILKYLNHVELFGIESVCKIFQNVSTHLNSSTKLITVKDVAKNSENFYFVCEKSLPMRSLKYYMITIFQLPTFSWEIYGTNPFNLSKLFQGCNYNLDTRIHEIEDYPVCFTIDYDPRLSVTWEHDIMIKYKYCALETKCFKINDRIAIILKNNEPITQMISN